MPSYERGQVRIHYEEVGSGFPLLVIIPGGGLNSSVAGLATHPFNLDDGSDFYVANQGDSTVVRMQQDGTVVAIREVTVNGQPLDNVVLNGIATSADVSNAKPLPSTIFATFVDPNSGQGGVLAMPAF